MATTTKSNPFGDGLLPPEVGVGELAVLGFRIGDFTFGVNVAVVSEVLSVDGITTLPQSHPSIRGVVRLRNDIVTCVSIADHLTIPATGARGGESTMIVTRFQMHQTAFLADKVTHIHRVDWKDVLRIPRIEELSHVPVTALARCDGQLIPMLDFEQILADVSNIGRMSDREACPNTPMRSTSRILLADDSPNVRTALSSTLRKAGYHGLTVFEDGDEAWNWLQRRSLGEGPLPDLLICDTEMPWMGGHDLCRRIKEHPDLRRLPVLLFSSVITRESRLRGERVGADAHLAKPQWNRVVEVVDVLIAESRERHGPIEAVAAPPDDEQTTRISILDDDAWIE